MKGPCPIEDGFDTSAFDSGVEALDLYLKQYARQTQKREGARTYVVLEANRVIAYYTLVLGYFLWFDGRVLFVFGFCLIIGVFFFGWGGVGFC